MPALDAIVVFAACLDPRFRLASPLAFPERRAGFEIIHQEFRSLECRLPVRRCDADEHDALAGRQLADAMHDAQRPESASALRASADMRRRFRSRTCPG